ncbi:hypothetical protein ACNI3Q_12775 [Sphingomonas sp. FW199]|uniref:hypothetical protein n=1 Tax=Sphingomonas sp. FW199 TaxID=3400217 RepID=UPI003CEB7D55
MRQRLQTALLIGAGLFVCAAVTTYIADRPKVLAAVCDLGLPNLSRPESIPADVLKCEILGERETIAGTIFSSDHGSSIIGENETEPVALYLARGFPHLAQQSERSWKEHCVDGATARVTGWRTQTPGSYGHLGFAKLQFYVESIDDVGPLPQTIVGSINDRTWCRAPDERDGN